MAKFFDSSTFPISGALLGDEVFIIYQVDQSRTTNIDTVLNDIIRPLVVDVSLTGLSDTNITSPLNGDVLVYNSISGYWENMVRDTPNILIDDIQDVIVSSPQTGQMLIYNGSLWKNDNDPILRNYTEIEYNIGLVSGTCNIDLANGNIQRLQVDGVLGIVLPTLPSTGQYWSLTLKVVSDGVNIPTFTSPDGTLKWYDGDAPIVVSGDESIDVYEFTSDLVLSMVYGESRGTIIVPLLGDLHQTLDNPNTYGTSADDQFGWSVSISDSYSIVGAKFEDDSGGTGSGKAYIFDNTTGNLLHALDNPNAYGTSVDDWFGYSVSISDSYCIVGAYQEDDADGTLSGKAYIFDNTTGNLLYTLDDPNPYGTSGGDRFGYSVSICEGYSIIGAYNENHSLSYSGAGKAYIFDNTTGNLLHTLNDPSAYGSPSGDRFGLSVSITESYSIVGAYGEDDSSGEWSGKAYIFNNATGNLLHTLDNPNAYGTSADDWFGWSVSISETHAIVGTHQEDDAGGTLSGKAYIFDNSTGNLLHTLNNPSAYSGNSYDHFGWSVSISESYCIVGTYAEDDADGFDVGKAYIFDNSTGNLLHTLDDPNAYGTSADDRFGYSVAITETHCIAGAYQEDDVGGTSSGKAYIFSMGEE